MLVCTATISADHWLVGSIPQNYTIVERRRRICSVTFFCFINNTYLASSWGVCRPAPVGSDCSSWGVWLLGGLDPPPQHWLALLGGLDPPPAASDRALGGSGLKDRNRSPNAALTPVFYNWKSDCGFGILLIFIKKLCLMPKCLHRLLYL